MAPTTPPPITKPEAQVAVVHHMLNVDGRQRCTEMFLIDGQAYRLTVEQLTAEELPAAARKLVQEMEDESDDCRD